MKKSFLFFTLFVCLVNLNQPQAEPLIEAKQALQDGRYEQSIVKWQWVLANTENTNLRLEAWFAIARAYRWIGLYSKALKTLNTALSIARQTDNSIYHVLLLNELSKVHFSQGEQGYEDAMETALQSVSLARKANNTLILANVLIHWGNLLTVDYDYEGAREAYNEALSYVDSSEKMMPMPPFSKVEMAALHGKILISQAQSTFLLETGDADAFEDKKQAFKATFALLEQARVATQNWQTTYAQAITLMSLSQLIQKIQAQLPQSSVQLRGIAYQVLRKALKIAERLDHAKAKSYAKGYLGQLYEQAKRYDEALFLTRQALFFAQKNHSQPLLYLWQRQKAHIKKQLGDHQGAIRDYQQAIEYLEPIRSQVITGYINFLSSFREQIAPVYFELADLLLQQASSIPVSSSRDKLLHDAINAIEDFKEAELQNHFHNDCIDIKSKCADLKAIVDSKTAILYPIMLPTRLELLLYRRGGFIQTTLPLGEKTLQKTVLSLLSRLRHQPKMAQVENKSLPAVGKSSSLALCRSSLRGSRLSTITSSSRSFLEPAKTLYNGLIKPLSPHLNDIDTLVVVPDGALRTIPFAALHDGQHFLIQHYALAVTPSLCFNDAPLFQAREKRILLSALSESVQGFSSLPCAAYEIGAIQTLFPKKQTTLLNKKFTTSNVSHNLNQASYSILHIASHGQFRSHLEDTFILTYNDKLSLDRLEQLISTTTLQNKPVDLLSLSACETAVGDDRAALGLAGVALKAGVKSAFASLWKVDDEATPAVVIEFYRQLQNQKRSKAKALQYAQKRMLTHQDYVAYRHPYYWSAFLLIGNWF